MFKLIAILAPIMLGIWNHKSASARLVKKLEAQSSTMADPIVSALVKKMAHSLDLKKIEVYILEDSNLNGLASPDGKVFITKGFLEKYYSGFVSAGRFCGGFAEILWGLVFGKFLIVSHSFPHYFRTILTVSHRFLLLLFILVVVVIVVGVVAVIVAVF